MRRILLKLVETALYQNGSLFFRLKKPPSDYGSQL